MARVTEVKFTVHDAVVALTVASVQDGSIVAFVIAGNETVPLGVIVSVTRQMRACLSASLRLISSDVSGPG